MTEEQLTRALQQYFGFTAFKPGQAEVLQALLAGQDTLAMLPTGGGKTLIYQMMGKLRSGLIVVVTPLLSLMQDQVARLNYAGDNRVVALNSMLSVPARQQILAELSRYHFLFISPEMLRQPTVIMALQRVKLNLLVIDEAHTIVSWGPDFRPDYLGLPEIYEQLQRPQLLMLTATATPAMMTDMTAAFKTTQPWFMYRQSVDRPNIHLHTEKLANEGDKRARLAQLVNQLSGPGIIYFASRKLATSMAEWLRENTSQRVAAYHAGLEAIDRHRIQQQFMQNDLDVITATSAFGMGIDKEDIRYVIHYHLSNDLANYLQEIGRAGRDGQQSVAVLLYVGGDEQLQFNMIDSTLPDQHDMEVYVNQKNAQKMITPDKMRLLSFYLEEKQYSVEHVTALFDKRAQQRRSDLFKMIDYAQATTNLRARLMQYFADNHHYDDTTESSGLAEWQPELLGLVAPKRTTSDLAGVTPWAMQLAELFNLG